MFWGTAQGNGEESSSCDSLFMSCFTAPEQPPPSIFSLKYVDSTRFVLCSQIFGPWMNEAIAECRELVALQNVDGSWTLSSGLASVLQVEEAEIKGKMPGEVRG